MSEKPSKERHRQTRSEDIHMEEILRNMSKETLAKLRRLEATGADVEAMAVIF